MLAIRPFFFADYRDLRDALVSARLRVRTDFLRGFLAERGIILGASSTREELIDAVAAYAYQASDLDAICDQLELPGRKDKLTYTVLPGVVTADIVHEALANLKKSRRVANERIDGDRVSGDGPISINVDYYEMHAERTMLRQMQPKHGTVQVMKVGDETRIRFPSTEHITELVADLIGEVNKLVPASDQLRPQAVSLAGFTKLQRTEFFQKLIGNIEGYKLDDVTKVNLNNEFEVVPMASDLAPGEDESEDEDTEDDASSSSATKTELESEVKALLRRASLDGSGILHATELKRFLASGFYISRISWSVKPRSKRDAKPRVEFEARLADPASGSGFEYGIRKVYRAKRDKTYNKIGVAPTELETAGLLEALEKAVQLSFEQVSEVL